MEIISSKSGKTDVLIGSILQQWYFRGDGGALLNEALPTDLSKSYQNGSFNRAVVAHKLDMVMITPQRPGYRAERRLTLGDFYKQELFREVWFIPVKAWKKDPSTDKYGEAIEMPPEVTSFLMRGRSIDEFGQLLKPFEQQAFMEWVKDKKALSKKYGSAKEFAQSKMVESFLSSIYTCEVVMDTGVKDYYFLEWSSRAPESEYEKELLEIGQTIGKVHAATLTNTVVEKAAEKAQKEFQLAGANGVTALPAGVDPDEINF